MFLPFTVTSVQEMTLGANLPLRNMNRLKWKPEFAANESFTYTDLRNISTVKLYPMQIRTFVLNVNFLILQ